MSEAKSVVERLGVKVAAAVVAACVSAGAVGVNAQAPPAGTGGPKEGIAVHGHWAIDIRQPDGTLVTHREFENALMDGGGLILAGTFARQVRPGRWRIVLGSSTTEDLPCEAIDDAQAQGPHSCHLLEPGIPQTHPSYSSYNLSVGGGNGLCACVILNATGTATRSGNISVVLTAVGSCPLSGCLDPSGDDLLVGGEFAGTTIRNAAGIATPIPVVPGQLIQVSVTYTFAAGATTEVH